MRKRVNYAAIIEEIKLNKNSEFVLDQKTAKRIGGNILPKSCFEENYIKDGKNELFRFLADDYEVKVIQPQIIISKKN